MNPVAGISVARIAIGAVAVASPATAAKMFGLDQSGNPQLAYMSRMFGSREIALGAITLATQGKSRTSLTALGIAIDGSDAFAGFDAGRIGAVSPSTAKMLTAPAVGAMVGGALGLVQSIRGRSAKPTTG